MYNLDDDCEFHVTLLASMCTTPSLTTAICTVGFVQPSSLRIGEGQSVEVCVELTEGALDNDVALNIAADPSSDANG